MRRVRKQCGAKRSTEAIAQPAARRPEAQRRDTPKKVKLFFRLDKKILFWKMFSYFLKRNNKLKKVYELSY
ncbi:MAG: hypothetical protein NZ455_16595 [Bacteroidia bacterium]|nr:hypothetical protein [Bacteroidia bacterium]MDW8348520.1 hypothetical protein [Bacteroidia bacterium]